MRLDELNWKPYISNGNYVLWDEARVTAKPGHDIEVYLIKHSDANSNGRSLVVGSYVIVRRPDDEWLDLAAIEAQAVLNYLLAE